ncbi:MAG: YbfB/YjiJ family MFS transporter [Rhizobiaceae bacterium]|nr:YbfB/YjiJ family MFS transporter [Rhizobiaceae bacterium]
MTLNLTTPMRYAVAGMAGMAVAMGIGRFVFTPILPSMMEELGLSTTDAGWIASANYLGYLVGAFAAAGAWGAGRERMLMLGGLVSTVLLAAAMGLTENLTAFLAIRFLAGVASAFVMVFLSAIVFSHFAAAGRSQLQSVHFGGVGIGIVASSLVMGALIAGGAHWQGGWYSAAILSAIGLAVVAYIVREGPVSHNGGSVEPRLPRDPVLVRLILSYGLFGFGYVVTATFLVTIVRQGDGGRLFESVVWLITGLSIIPSVHLWEKLARRRGAVAVYIAGCLLEAVGVAASVAFGGWIGPLIGGALLGGTFVAITAFGIQAARMRAPQSPRRAFALMTASFGVGQILGPLAAGALAHRTGSFFAPSMLAALVLLVAAAIVWPARR